MRFSAVGKGLNISQERFVWLCIALLFLLRFISAALIDLSPQEAYYWNYAMHPALSYFDHPPMVAWVIRAGTLFLGNSKIGVRIGGLLLTLLSTWLLYRLGKLWFNRRAGLWAAFLFQIIPLYFVYGVIIAPDVPLIFFWLLTIHLISIALLKDQKWAWYLTGLSAGLSMLSKYTGFFLIASALFFLVVERRYRKWLLGKEPYIALLIASLVFSPVIIWNYQHQWVSFAFQFIKRLGAGGKHPIRHFGEFFATQTGAIFPALFPGLLLALALSFWLTTEDRHPKWKLCFCFSFPILTFFTFYSFRSLVKVNWTLPGYLPLLFAAYPCYRYFCLRSGHKLRRFARKSLQLSFYTLPALFAIALYHMTIALPHIPVPWVVGWEELGRIVEEEKKAFEAATGKESFLLGMGTHDIASELAFYTARFDRVFSQNVLGKPALAFEYWNDQRYVVGRNALVVDSEFPEVKLLSRYFVSVDRNIKRISITQRGRTIRYFYLVKCYGYLGRPRVALENRS